MRAPGRLPRLYWLALGLTRRSFRRQYATEIRETLAATEAEYAHAGRLERSRVRLREALALVRAGWHRPSPGRSAVPIHSGPTIELLVRDLVHAVRGLAKSPGFTAIVVLTLALGIGANTAIYTVVDAVLLAPLPYPDSDRLMFIWQELTNRGAPYYPSAEADLVDYAEAAAIADIGGIWSFSQSLTDDDGPPERISAAHTTVNFLDLLGVRPALGRGFRAEDGAPLGPDATRIPVASLISWELWQRRYGGDPSIVGRTLDVGDGQGARIVGVMPPGMRLLTPTVAGLPETIDVWHAARIDFAQADRSGWYIVTLARLRPGATLAQAQAQLQSVNAWQWQQHPIYANAGTQTRIAPLHTALTSPARPGVVTLAGAVGFVLLIACVNVANLLLVRASGRSRELAVRAALGAGGWRLAREQLLESLVLASAGGVLGLGLAAAGIRWLVVMGPSDLPRLADVTIHGGALVFTAGACVAVALACGLLVAARASRPRVVEALRGRGQSDDHGADRIRRALVVTEVALSLVLLVGAGLMIRSLDELLRVDLGFRPQGVITFEAAMGAVGDDDQAQAPVKDRMLERLAALPGVTAVGATNSLPLGGGRWAGPYGNEEEATDGDESDFRQADFRLVIGDYFDAVGTPLLAGRLLDEDDARHWQQTDGPPTQDNPAAAVIDTAVAERSWPGDDPLGKLLYAKTIGPGWLRVVGVVGAQRMTAIGGEPRGTVYLPDLGFQAITVAAHTGIDPVDLVPAIRQAVAEVDPRIPLARIRPLQSYVDEALAPTRFASTLIGGFAAVALLLAVLGLYGTLAWTVRQRTAEMGVRMALGATAARIRVSVVRQGLRLAVVGVALGILVALSLSRLISSLLYAVSPSDPLTYFTIVVLFMAVAAVACWIPAHRATRVDPLRALRAD